MLLAIAFAAGSLALALLSGLCLGTVCLSWRRLAHTRLLVVERDFGSRQWSVEELRALAPLESSPLRDADEPRKAPSVTGRGAVHHRASHLLDRWTWTQVLWAGVMGWIYGELVKAAEWLVAGSSYSFLRKPTLALVHRLLTHLGPRDIRRTIATSALLTASTTGLLATAAVATTSTAMAAAAPANVVLTTAVIYTVQPGDTLWGIAQRFGTTVDALVAANSIANPDLIFPGQVLTIASSAAAPVPPVAGSGASAPTTYTVQPGDTLSAIAQRFGTTVDALVAANSIANPDLIYPGQVLTIASSATIASAPPQTGPAAPSTPGAYQNPLRAINGLVPERVDQGVDYAGAGPIYAIGDGVVLNTTNAGWPGGAFISYQLSDGPAAGDIVYVAENVEPVVWVGEQVNSSTVLGTLVDAYPDLETGWAAPPGNGDSLASATGQWSAYAGANSLPTAYGENFSELLAALGAPPGLSEGPVQGSLPPGWPSW